MTHIKIFTLCETNDDVVTDLRKSSKISSLDSQESNSNTFSTKNNLPIQDSLVNKSPSMVIASNSYSNSLLELKCKKDIELGLFENCQKQMFCGVWKCFGKNNQKKQNLNCNS